MNSYYVCDITPTYSSKLSGLTRRYCSLLATERSISIYYTQRLLALNPSLRPYFPLAYPNPRYFSTAPYRLDDTTMNKQFYTPIPSIYVASHEKPI